MANNIRTRIAPSPTGYLHVGTARAALFNELYAHQQGGQFIVRIEDTDRARSAKKFEDDILEGLKWLGLTWDEGPDQGGEYAPYRQSERTHLYRAALEKLLSSGQAYQKEDSPAIYLKVEAQEVTFSDIIRGEVTIHTDTWGGDFVIARNLDDPVFHLAVVVDDDAHRITHIIRGEDHVTNTGRHILLQRALGYNTPQYAHLPLLLDRQRRKLSKRAGEVNLLSYRDRGYLPEAMLNYLALLGWSPKTDEEFFTHRELIERFSLAGVQKGGAIFDEEKLVAMNKHYVRALSPSELLEKARPFLQAKGYNLEDTTYWAKAVRTEQERIGVLSELPEALGFYRPDWPADYPKERLVWKKSDSDTTSEIIKQLSQFIEQISPDQFKEEVLTKSILEWIDTKGLGRGDTLWPMRVALTGQENSPGPFEVAAVLGKETTLTRLQLAWDKLN